MLTRAAGDEGMFGVPVFCDSLVDNIGLDEDDNNNLSRRMLLVSNRCPPQPPTSTSLRERESSAGTSTNRSRTSGPRASC